MRKRPFMLYEPSDRYQYSNEHQRMIKCDRRMTSMYHKLYSAMYNKNNIYRNRYVTICMFVVYLCVQCAYQLVIYSKHNIILYYMYN